MCNQCPNPEHDPLNDELPDSFFDDFGREKASVVPVTPYVYQPAPKPTFEERCPVSSCRNGTWYSWAGRPVGPCRKCHGTGKVTYKQAPEARARQRQYAEKRAVRKQAEVTELAAQWKLDNPIETQWIRENAGQFEFATAMRDAVIKYGALTEGQLAAVRRCVARNVARNEQRAAEQVQRETNAPTVNIQPIIDSFNRAMSNKVRSPKLRLDTFKFSRAPDHGSNPGAIYVTEQEVYLGKIVDGKLITSRACNDETRDRIVAVCADPAAAAEAYGRRYGKCSICGRELTKGESIDRAIGPICAEKYGFM